MREADLYPQVKRFLEGRGWLAAIEVPLRKGSKRRFDIAGVGADHEDVVVVEAKLGRWSAVIQQALESVYVADFVYACFPLPYARKAFSEWRVVMRSLGIGLLGVDGKVVELVSPRRSTRVDPLRRARLIEMLDQVRR